MEKEYIKLSPTKIKAALACPARYWYRYVEGLEPRRTPSALAFGRAVHQAIAAAYARQNAPMTAEEVADVFTTTLIALDKQGISYKDDETLEDRQELKTVRGKEKDVKVLGLNSQGRYLVAVWWQMQRELVLAARVKGVEAALTIPIADGLDLTCRVDVAEVNNGVFTLGDHKTASSWGAADEQEAAMSLQMFAEVLCWERERGERPESFYFNVLKKTKEPQVFRYHVSVPDGAALASFEDELIAYGEMMREIRSRGRPVRHVSRDCGWCSFTPFCWGVDGARDNFTTRADRPGSHRAVVETAEPEDGDAD
jgi:RecB family exonuclease